MKSLFARGFALAALAGGAVLAPVQAQVAGSCRAAVGEAYLDVNQVRARILNNGSLFYRGEPHVYEVPKGGGANAVFASGIWIGGQVNGQLRAAATTYGPYEFWAGPLSDNGDAPADCSPFDKVWKVSKRDVRTYEQSQVATPDLQSWPTGLGAPTMDANGNRIDVLSQPLTQRRSRVINLAAGERPIITGDQMLWWIMNDVGNTHVSTETAPIGIEVHGSAFAFNLPGALGNTTFYRYRIFKKGSASLSNTYIALFSDPDLGDAFDDYVGSDSVNGIGYVYNADNLDADYGEAPPALGYDFFQGPTVPGAATDTALRGGMKVPGFRNLPMTSFVYYNNGSGINEDPDVGPDYYNYMQARWKDGRFITEGGDGLNNNSSKAVRFMFPADPATRGFWSEFNADGQGNANTPADRRFVLSSGPFNIAAGDEQEIVFGIVWSKGTDNLNSVTKLKSDDRFAQSAFNVNFELPAPPDPPTLTAQPLNGRVVLEWSNDPGDNNYLEDYRVVDPLADPADNDYVFEGYEVIQFESPRDSEGRIIATYDVANGITRVIEQPDPADPSVITAEGTDRGVQRFHIVDALTNNTTYYFAVRAYAYNALSGQKVYKGAASDVVAVTPSARNSVMTSDVATGAADNGATADLTGVRTGIGQGAVTARVVNPAAIVGTSYLVPFRTVQVGAQAVTVYDLVRVNRDGSRDTLFNGRTYAIQNGAAPPQRSNVLQYDGLSFSINGPAAAFQNIVQVNAQGQVIDTNIISSLNTLAQASDVRFVIFAQGVSTTTTPSFATVGPRIDWRGNIAARTPIDIEFRFVADPEQNGQFCVTYSGGTANPLMEGWVEGVNRLYDQGDSTYTKVPRGQMAGEGGRMPFQVWELFPDGTSRQVECAIFDDDGDDQWSLTQPSAYAPLGYERIYTYATPYVEADYLSNPAAVWNRMKPNSAPVNPTVGRLVFTPYFATAAIDPDQRYFAAPPSPGTRVRMVTTKPNLPGDVFTVDTDTLMAREFTAEELEASLDRMAVVPNPYRGASDYETSQLVDEARFTNLPEGRVFIRVFTLNGTLVRELEKNGPDSFLPWDLTTAQGLPIASGMYLVHMNVEGVGERIIKFGVVKKRTQLNVF